MTRPELVAILSDLVRRSAISLADARAVLTAFDSGQLTDMPLPAAQGEQEENSWFLALALLLLLLGSKTVGILTAAQGLRAQELLRTQYEAQVGQLAASVASGGSIATWQAGMQTATAQYARQMAIAGAGTLPKPSVRTAVDTELRGQWSYLAAFAVTLIAGKIAGKLMSEAAIRSRSVLYGQTGWGAFARGAEPVAGTGWIVHYQARDDDSTCAECSEAERSGPYAYGSNFPRPGEICRGRGRCRCKLKYEYNPAAYARLTRRAA
jgi:hypothetical protein